jgi:hypothetical protein
MDIIEYPETDYNSWVTEDEAFEYFDGRLNTEAWDTAGTKSIAALLTAFRSLKCLNITIDPTEADQLQALKESQCEQALFELTIDTDGQPINAMTLGGLLSVKMAPGNVPPSRYSKRAMQSLGPYLSAPVVTRTR